MRSVVDRNVVIRRIPVLLKPFQPKHVAERRGRYCFVIRFKLYSAKYVSEVTVPDTLNLLVVTS
jgi:hypothetical protein